MDRDYLHPTDWSGGRRWGVIGILIATVAMFFVQAAAGRVPLLAPLIQALQLRPSDVIGSGYAWQVVTYLFLHSPDSILHLVFNMLFLYWFGKEVEELYGTKKFLVLYFGAGILGGLLYIAGGYIEGHPQVPVIGASGAVMGVLVVAAFHFPRRPILLFFILPVPLALLVVLYVLIDLYLAISGYQPVVASMAHLGGALFGFGYYQAHRAGWTFGWLRLSGLSRLRSRAHGENLFALDREVDQILDKISREGIQSLTPAERAVLDRASREKRKEA
jgi:membrane associated rhomboid family serine protease